MNCSNCQNPIQQGEKFCGKCGQLVKKRSSLEIFLLKVSLVIGLIMGIELFFFKSGLAAFIFGFILAGVVGFIIAKVRNELKLRNWIVFAIGLSCVFIIHFIDGNRSDLLSRAILLVLAFGLSVFIFSLGKRLNGIVGKKIAITMLYIFSILFLLFSVRIGIEIDSEWSKIQIKNNPLFFSGCNNYIYVDIGVSKLRGNGDSCFGVSQQEIDKIGSINLSSPLRKCYGIAIRDDGDCEVF